ncbi:MAG: PQQ-binding-like beta-propeller repeat protein, partial [Planctomycetes bacterium]|nr:PQQ-binding-like beta-propeller repeat protein [Planctomycetota bacterium]
MDIDRTGGRAVIARAVISLAGCLCLLYPAGPAAAQSKTEVPAEKEALEILRLAGVKGGLVVHLGCGDGRLTAALRAGPQYLVQGLDADPADVAAARRHIRSLGLYGPVSVERWSAGHLPYAGNLVNLLVASDMGGVSMAEAMRVVAPGGAICLRKAGRWVVHRKARPKDIDEWTHYLYDASNNAVSHDALVGPPRRYQWIAPPRWARSHDHLSTTSAMVSAGGRVFYIIDEGPTLSVAMAPRWRLVARDAFSGVLLWERSIGPWEGHLRDFRSGPPDLARRLVAVGRRVYVTPGYGKGVWALDAATGKTVMEYPKTDNAMEIIVSDGVLFVVAGDRPPDDTGGAAVPKRPTAKWYWWAIYRERPPRKHLVAIRAETGEVLWEKSDDQTAWMMPTALAVAGGRVFFQNDTELVALDASTGRLLWHSPRPVNLRRPAWSAPTLVAYGSVVICGDRAVNAPPPRGYKPAGDRIEWVVTSVGGNSPPGEMIAFDAATGKRLWQAPCRESYNSPPDLLVADGLVWSGNLVHRSDPGITRALDPLSGKVVRTRPADQKMARWGMSHHRCYRNKATEKYLLLGRDGIELVDVKTGKLLSDPWVRGACQYGIMPANGFIYVPPHSCACHIETKISNFNAVATEASSPSPPADAGERSRLVKGPAYGLLAPRPRAGGAEGDWPTYRHDAARSGRSSCIVPAELKRTWQARLSDVPLSSPVIAGGRVFVAAAERHEVIAADAGSGKTLWRFTAGGRVDSPPTIWAGRAIFGCADGWIYCLRAADGALAWRFRAAPGDRRIVAFGRVESSWPIHGSVLVEGGSVYAVAGRCS